MGNFIASGAPVRIATMHLYIKDEQLKKTTRVTLVFERWIFITLFAVVNIIKPFWVGNLDFALAETTKKEQFNTSNSKCLLKTVENVCRKCWLRHLRNLLG